MRRNANRVHNLDAEGLRACGVEWQIRLGDREGVNACKPWPPLQEHEFTEYK